MKHLCTIAIFVCLFFGNAYGQLSLQNGISTYTIDFDASVSGVNAGSFTGAGFTNTPSGGQLDADAWATTGFSDGSKNFGTANTSGDHARGSSNGGVSTGGLYGFDLGGGNRALGIQPTGGDWTPGTMTLKIVNNSSAVINDMTIDYTIYERNDQGRSSSFNFSYSADNSSYTNVAAANFASTQGSGSTAWVTHNRSIQLTNLSIDPSAVFYLRWAGGDNGGSGSRDELALDDIIIMAAGSSNTCLQPTAPPTNLNFGTISSNSIQANFTASSADKFLVVQSTSPTLGATPTDGVIYSVGNSLGNGEVLQYSNSTSINSLALQNNTTYYFSIFAANDNCSGGPDYLNTNALTGAATTMGNGNSTYYSSIGNETCASLKTALFNLIDGHTTVSYNSLWTYYQTTDDHLNDSGSEVIVWDVYSDNPTGSENEFTFVSEQCGSFQGEGDCYNREHTFPRSWWGGATSVPQYTDLFTVLPVDGWINGIRSNNPYGEIQSGTETRITNNGSALGASSISIPGYSGAVFEPIDAYKGDLARGYFYMATRYENQIAGWENSNTESDAVLDGTAYPVFEQWMIDMLISWHNNDPVDQKEIDRNEAIFGIQGNRNPFIDHPEYVALIWNNCNGGGDTQAPTNPSNLTANNTTETTTNLSWNGSTDNVDVVGYKVYRNGVNVLTTNGTGTTATVSGLTSNTTYSFFVTAYDAAGNESNASNTINVTTPFSDTTAPTAPSSLTANNTTETTTDLSWNASTDNVGVVGYYIYQDDVFVGSATTTNSNMVGLTAGTTYTFFVTAYDAAGNESAASNTIDVTTLSPSAATVLHEGYFESGWDGWQDGGSDCARRSGSEASEGNYSIRIRDNSGTASAMTSPTFDLSSYTTVDIDFSFYPRSMENNEDFWLRYYDGSSWQTIATFVRGTDFNNNVFYTANVSIDNSNYNFASNARFRFQCDASGNNDQIFIDAVIITADAANGSRLRSPSNPVSIYVKEPAVDNASKINGMELDKQPAPNASLDNDQVSIYPNPATDILHIDWRSVTSEIVQMEIVNTMGQIVSHIAATDENSFIQKDVSDLPNGLYFLKIINRKNEIQTIKFYVN